MQLDDVEAVQGLIVELALFEKCPLEVRTSKEDLLTNLQEGIFEGKVAVNEYDIIIGMALFFPYYSTWNGKTLYLEDFYVKPEFRSMGVGQELFEAFKQTALAHNAKLLKWQVLDWNVEAKKFYLKNGALFQTGWENGIIRL